MNWEQQDQLLLSWILASMSDTMLIRMVGCEYFHQVWTKLEEILTSNHSPNFGGHTGSFRGNFRGGRGRGRFGNNNRPQCQVCGKVGHMARQCYHRFNPQFFFIKGSILSSLVLSTQFLPLTNIISHVQIPLLTPIFLHFLLLPLCKLWCQTVLVPMAVNGTRTQVLPITSHDFLLEL